jgi:hypothetical protein
VSLEQTGLIGEVEVDETWVGGHQPGRKGRTRRPPRPDDHVLWFRSLADDPPRQSIDTR